MSIRPLTQLYTGKGSDWLYEFGRDHSSDRLFSKETSSATLFTIVRLTRNRSCRQHATISGYPVEHHCIFSVWKKTVSLPASLSYRTRISLAYRYSMLTGRRSIVACCLLVTAMARLLCGVGHCPTHIVTHFRTSSQYSIRKKSTRSNGSQRHSGPIISCLVLGIRPSNFGILAMASSPFCIQ